MAEPAVAVDRNKFPQYEQNGKKIDQAINAEKWARVSKIAGGSFALIFSLAFIGTAIALKLSPNVSTGLKATIMISIIAGGGLSVIVIKRNKTKEVKVRSDLNNLFNGIIADSQGEYNEWKVRLFELYGPHCKTLEFKPIQLAVSKQAFLTWFEKNQPIDKPQEAALAPAEPDQKMLDELISLEKIYSCWWSYHVALSASERKDPRGEFLAKIINAPDNQVRNLWTSDQIARLITNCPNATRVNTDNCYLEFYRIVYHQAKRPDLFQYSGLVELQTLGYNQNNFPTFIEQQFGKPITKAELDRIQNPE